MATSATPVAGQTGNNLAWDVVASADGDTSVAINHGMTFADPVGDLNGRVRIILEPRGAKFYTQNWIVNSLTAATLVLQKTSTAATTGDATSQVRVHLNYLAGPYRGG